jgi:cardiolipin synthase
MAGAVIGEVINAPNLLTLARILLTPFIVFTILSGEPVQALALMFIAGLTDMLDGAIAKRFNLQTAVGAYMDPIADKLMLVSAIVSLFIIDQAPLFLFLAVFFRDVIIIMGAIAYEMVTHRLKMEPTFLSKATTTVQIIFVLLILLSMAVPLPLWIIQAATWLTFIITCLSGVQYMVLWMLKAVRETDN